MTSHTPQPPAGDDLVARLRRLVDDQEGGDAVILIQRQLLNKIIGRLDRAERALTQHTEPVAGEVEVVAWRWKWPNGEHGFSSHQPTMAPTVEPLVTKSSYDALAAKLRYVRELADSDHDELAELLKAAERQRDALRGTLQAIADQPHTYKDKVHSYGVGYAFEIVQQRARAALKDEGGST